MDAIIYSDLDDTLLDASYSFEDARHALDKLSDEKVPVILCSSKTRAEIEAVRKKMKITDPFISENGSAVFIPEDSCLGEDLPSRSGYRVIELGSSSVAEKVKNLRDALGLSFKTFTEMSAKEIAEETGLTVGEARLAGMREYSDVLVDAADSDIETLKENGVSLVRGGRYWCACESSKGDAVKALTVFYGDVKTYGFGDSENDKDMLEVVDVSVLVRRPDGSYADVEADVKTEGVGPRGWFEAVSELILLKGRS